MLVIEAGQVGLLVRCDLDAIQFSCRYCGLVELDARQSPASLHIRVWAKRLKKTAHYCSVSNPAQTHA